MEKINTASKLKQVVVSNLRQLSEHRADARLKTYYDRWGELSELERAYVFRIEAEQERWPTT